MRFKVRIFSNLPFNHSIIFLSAGKALFLSLPWSNHSTPTSKASPILAALFSASLFVPFSIRHAEDGSFDVVIANHMLFYCEDLEKVFSEIRRVLKPGGRMICSTYSSRHMQEVSKLVREFDDRIILSADVLFDKFGKDNGGAQLSQYFSEVSWQQFEDSLTVTKPEPLIAYILSCHGNQNRYIVDKYHDFYNFVKKKTDRGFAITKDAGAFIATVK